MSEESTPNTIQTCCENGHDYAYSAHNYCRDKHGIAFKGEGTTYAAKYAIIFCRRCAHTVEIQIQPKLENRNGKVLSEPPDPKKQPIYMRK